MVFETKNTLVVDHPLNAKYDGYVDLRVFGDNSNIVLNSPISVSTGNTWDKQGDGWIRLVAPDGAITGSLALTFDAPNSHLIYKAKDAPTGTLQTHLEKLTLAYAAHGRPGDISIVEQDDLILTSLDHYDTPFRSGVVFGDETFSGITWTASATARWLNEVRDDNDLYALVVPNGTLTIHLLGFDALLYLDAGMIITETFGKAITILADDVSFRSGASQVVGTGDLSIQANQQVWNYRLGTAGENAAGSDLARDAFARSMDLTSGDLAALADGFSKITIGRYIAGNTMIIGDAFDSHVIKYTGEARDRDARFRDPTFLFTDTLTIAGDVEATGRLEIKAMGAAQ
ncbi:MAG: hypothetical protein EBV06_18175, partial [Planctomycetia bacterium]|nr:hypothetical protein [Planctomycetia bacterium]